MFLFIKTKIGGTTKNLKTISGSSTDYNLSNHTIYGPTQTRATVLLTFFKAE
jgi:hypothetical protein